MRAFKFIIFGLVALCEVAFAQQGTGGGPAKTILVEKTLDANPLPNGKAYRIEFLLKNGKKVAYEISPPEAAKVADGLSKQAIAGGQREQVATLVYGMNMQVDSKGLAVVLTPRGRYGPLEPLAIPISGVDQFLALLQTKIAEARANASKQPKQP